MGRETADPIWRQPRGEWMVSLVNSCTNATSKRWHLREINLRFALNSTLLGGPGPDGRADVAQDRRVEPQPIQWLLEIKDTHRRRVLRYG
jgi:hypothetical protein